MYLLTVIDRSMKWVEAMPLKNMEVATCVENFVDGWVARFGVPASVMSDRDAQFTSAAWVELCERLGIQHVLTTAYHPQSNGMVERVHKQLKEALRARAVGAA
jgi:transposase InsO family protein